MTLSAPPEWQTQLEAAHARIEELEQALARRYDVGLPQLEQALHRSEARAEAMLAAVPDQIYRLDREGVFLDYKADERDFYYQGDMSIIGMSCRDILPPELVVTIEQKIATALETRTLQVFEYQLSHLDEGPRYYEARMVPSGPDEVISIVREVTQRRADEQALRDSAERFRLVVENSPSPILIWDEQGSLRYVSPSMAQALGYSPAEFLAGLASLPNLISILGPGEPTVEFLLQLGVPGGPSALNLLEMVKIVRYCASHPGEKVQVEVQHPSVTGELRDLLGTHQGFHSSATGSEVVSILHDVTEHRTLARMLAKSNVELERQVAERTAELRATVAELERANAGKDAFLAAVSHELRTPLMGILGMSELLADEAHGPLTAQQLRDVTTIHESGQRLQDTVNGVLLYTNLMTDKVPLRHERCHLAELAASAYHSCKGRAGRKRQQINLTTTPSDLEVESDSQAIVTLLKELLDNAIKFTPDEGHIDVTITADSAGEGIAIVVADTGIGMTAEQVEGLFRPFSQGDQTLARRFEGLGLGLACVHKIVELLGGSIAVASQLGEGTRFTVHLPCRP